MSVRARPYSIVFVLLVGCMGEPTVQWQLGFADAALEERAVQVEAFLVRGGCAGSTRVYQSSFGALDGGPDLPRLEPGVYGFAAHAGDRECRVYADGCVAVEIPTARSVIRVVMAQDRGGQRCEPGSCEEGFCVDPDPMEEPLVDETPMDETPMDETPMDETPVEVCPDGQPLEWNGTSYLLCDHTESTQRLSWEQSRDACASLGMHLVTIDDEAEDDWLGEELSRYERGAWWIGLHDVDGDGTYEWLVPPSTGYTNWRRGQGRGSFCGAVDGQRIRWEARNCSVRRRFVCEAP